MYKDIGRVTLTQVPREIFQSPSIMLHAWIVHVRLQSSSSPRVFLANLYKFPCNLYDTRPHGGHYNPRGTGPISKLNAAFARRTDEYHVHSSFIQLFFYSSCDKHSILKFKIGQYSSIPLLNSISPPVTPLRPGRLCFKIPALYKSPISEKSMPSHPLAAIKFAVTGRFST